VSWKTALSCGRSILVDLAHRCKRYAAPSMTRMLDEFLGVQATHP